MRFWLIYADLFTLLAEIVALIEVIELFEDEMSPLLFYKVARSFVFSKCVCLKTAKRFRLNSGTEQYNGV